MERSDPRGCTYYWIGGEPPSGVPEEGTDIGALDAGYISITPIVMGLTDYRNLSVLRAWQITLEDRAGNAQRGRVPDSAPPENEP